MDLENIHWGEYKIGDLFNVYTGGDLIIYRIEKGVIPIISHSIEKNGIVAWSSKIEGRKLFNHNTSLSLADRGNFYAYAQNIDFYIGTRVKALEAKFPNCNFNILQFICPAINKQSVKFSYGNNATGGTEKIKILLPQTLKGEPDYSFMEAYILEKETEKTNLYKSYCRKNLKKLNDIMVREVLDDKEWGIFEINEILNIKSGKRLTKEGMSKGLKPFIGATDSNNGITEFVSNTNSSEDSNILGVNYNGSVVENFYHPYKAIFSDDVKRLSLKNIKGNKYIYLFIKTQILKQKGKYQYGYKFNGKRMNKQKIMLPLNGDKNPDFAFMENFMKKVEFLKLKMYLGKKSN